METCEQNEMAEDAAEAIARLRSGMPEKARERADRIAEVNSKHVTTSKDAALTEEIEMLIQSAASSHGDPRGDGAALVVIGDSGAGKTTLLKRIFANRNEFQPYEDRYGISTSPLISVVAPSPCTLKQLGRGNFSERSDIPWCAI